MEVRIDIVYPEELAVITAAMTRVSEIRDAKNKQFLAGLHQQAAEAAVDSVPSAAEASATPKTRKKRETKKAPELGAPYGATVVQAEEVAAESPAVSTDPAQLSLVEAPTTEGQTLVNAAPERGEPPAPVGEKIKLAQLEDALRGYLASKGFAKTKSLLANYNITRLGEATEDQYASLLADLTV